MGLPLSMSRPLAALALAVAALCSAPTALAQGREQRIADSKQRFDALSRRLGGVWALANWGARPYEQDPNWRKGGLVAIALIYRGTLSDGSVFLNSHPWMDLHVVTGVTGVQSFVPGRWYLWVGRNLGETKRPLTPGRPPSAVRTLAFVEAQACVPFPKDECKNCRPDEANCPDWLLWAYK